MGVGVTVALLLGGAAFVFGLRWLESAMTFHPVRFTADQRISPPNSAEEVWFTAKDGTRLHGWYFARQRNDRSATIIYFHGNGGNLSNVGWLGESLAKRGFSVLLFDYRGYGLSSGTTVDEADLYLDGEAAWEFVVNEKKAAPERVVLYGQSLGTAIATETATRRRTGALILESGFSSASSLAETALPWLPRWLHRFGRNRFESARKLGALRIPVLVSHGNPDDVIPVSEGRKLFAAANEPKKLLIVPGVGHNVFGSAGTAYLDQLDEFIRRATESR
jgi:uncharacterized protein